MSTELNKTDNNELEEVSLISIINKLKEWIKILKSKILFIVLFGLIVASIVFYFVRKSKITYSARISFITEDSKASSSIGGISSIASQFGMDLGGGSSGGGSLLFGDNIFIYFKSEFLTREVLFSKFSVNSNKLMADIYAELNGYKASWEKNPQIGKVDFFVLNETKKRSRMYDSLIQSMVSNIVTNEIIVERKDKKASILEVTVTMVDEQLAKSYAELLINKATELYIDLKTRRQQISVSKLQMRADSITNLLNRKTIAGASLQTASSIMDINPIYKSDNIVASEKTSRDKSILSVMYSSVIQNLEMARFNLSQETPVIQILDVPILPLKKNKSSIIKPTILGFLFGSFLCIFYLLIQFEYRRIVLKK